MKKHFFILTLLFVFGIGFANTPMTNISEALIDNDPEVKVELVFNSIEDAENFNINKFEKGDFSYLTEMYGEDCTVTGSVSVTVKGTVGSSVFGGSVEVSATVTLSVTASCAEIDAALDAALASARAAALRQIQDK